MSHETHPFLAEPMDLSALGLLPVQGTFEPYFCTPVGAQIFGQAGVDGIHYCLIEGFGEMVFGVEPMPVIESYIQPIAKDLDDFVRLILACGTVDAVQQAYLMDEFSFDIYLQMNPPDEEGMEVLEQLRERYAHLAPMEAPWQYITGLRRSFDYDAVPYSEEFYRTAAPGAAAQPEEETLTLPEWKVCFEEGFYAEGGSGRAAAEIPIRYCFRWGEEEWLIPSVYAAGKGLVVDYIKLVPSAQIRSWMDRYGVTLYADETNLDRQQIMERESNDPLSAGFRSEVTINRRKLSPSYGTALSWNPLLQEAEPIHLGVMEHYQLDPSTGWYLERVCYPWSTKRKPSFHKLELLLTPEPKAYPAGTFKAAKAGKKVTLHHPLTDQLCQLTVVQAEQKRQSIPSDQYSYPEHFTILTYTLSPDRSNISVQDTAVSDQPRARQLRGGYYPEASAYVGMLLTGSEQEGSYRAASALHFEPVKPGNVVWQVVYYETDQPEMRLSLELS